MSILCRARAGALCAIGAMAWAGWSDFKNVNSDLVLDDSFRFEGVNQPKAGENGSWVLTWPAVPAGGVTLMTMFLGALDLRSGQVHYVNAGHCSPIWIHREDGNNKAIVSPSSPLGIGKAPSFGAKKFTLAPGDALFL